MTESDPLKPLGLFGGTFDPVHLAHLRLAEEALDRLKLEQIIWIPAGQPPHRDTPQASGRQRLEMVQLATADNAAFIVDATEVETASLSYTVSTLARLRRQYGIQRSLVLLVGADAFSELPGWHCWQTVFDYAHIAVACRPGYPLKVEQWHEALQSKWQTCYLGDSADSTVLTQLACSAAGNIVTFPMTLLDISATRIRKLYRHGASVRYLLPDALIHYIQNRQIYQDPI